MNAGLPPSAVLLREASAATGLDDFGEPTFMVGMERLLASIGSESDLTEGGRAALHAALVKRLTNRLEIEDWYRRHPEIEQEMIRDPVFIVGLPRTGTTAVGHMLALDPQTRSLRTWEAAEPCPPPELASAYTDPRIAENEARELAFEAVAPGVRDALPRDRNAPTECFSLMELSFTAASECGFLRCHDFMEWVLADERDELFAAYRYHRRVLKLLQWRHPARRWVLRSPIHAYAMEPLLAAYPDARFIMTHRDPAKVIPSVCSLAAEVRKVFLAERCLPEMGAEWTRNTAVGLQRLMRFRERIGEDRFVDVPHGRQMADPVGTMADIYAALGWNFGEDLIRRVTDWRLAHPKGSHNPQPADFGIDPPVIDELFADYRKQFAVHL